MTKINIDLNSEVLLKRNNKLKDIYKGRTVHILGNGPSINNVKIDKIKTDVIICVNEFYLIEKLKDIKPNFVVIADPYYFDESKKYFNQLMDEFKKRNNNINIFMPIDIIDLLKINQEIYNFIEPYYFKFNDKAEYDINIVKEIKPIAQNVINMCLILSLYCGAEKIYLHGVDHDILEVTEELYNKGWNTPHAYDNSKANIASLKFNTNGKGWSWIEMVKSIMVMQYEIINKLAKIKKIPILNCTPGSKLKVFPFENTEFN